MICASLAEQPLRIAIALATFTENFMLILIVEDEPIIAINLALALEAAGHTVVGPVMTGPEAIELARQHGPALALVDITLNGQPDGIDVARALQRVGVPAIFLSAQGETARANADAAIGFIAKPYATASVCESLEIVDGFLAGRTPLEQSGVLEVFPATVSWTGAHREASGRCDPT